MVKCRRCKYVNRKETCSLCSGKGKNLNDEKCISCDGKGTKNCFSCSGKGKYECKKCKGTRCLRWYLDLHVQWRTHECDYLEENCVVPSDILKKAKGTKIYEDAGDLVVPIPDTFPVYGVIEKSQQIVTSETARLKYDKRVVAQRQTVNVIPVSEINWTYKDNEGIFAVYGDDNVVYFPDYPQKCCCVVL